jgi:polyhydroxyalkanoate synthesis repressor PhaR
MAVCDTAKSPVIDSGGRMASAILFKKYANRRLYNTVESRYMALTDIAELVRDGREIRVVDAKTQEDVTAFILTQIVLEQAKNKQMLLPVPLLHLIIQYGDTELTDFFEKHLKRIILNYMDLKHSADRQFLQWLNIGKDLTASVRQGLKTVSSFYDEPKEKKS